MPQLRHAESLLYKGLDNLTVPPRPLIRALVQVNAPKIGETIYDSACGSAGFLCESYDYLRAGELTTQQLKTLQTRTFYGKEKKSLAYIIGIMNMNLHGIEAPKVRFECLT